MPHVHSDSSKDELQKRWRDVLGMVEVQIDNQADFNAYLADSTAIGLDDGVLSIEVRNGFVETWIRQRAMRTIRRFSAQVFGDEIKVEILTTRYMPSDVLLREGLAGDHWEWRNVQMKRQRDAVARDNASRFPIDPKSNFERFETSKSNALALNAAKRVAETPGEEFNPLTIAAETGQGKTHLLNAIGNELRSLNLNVVCLKGEEFVDRYVKSTQSGSVSELRDIYRGADALLIDGIERLIKRQSTQSFFLAIVDHLLSNQKQVVVTFNTAYQITGISDEITSRLAGGLEVRIDEPDYDLARAVIQQYAAERQLPPLAEGAFEHLRDVTVNSVRELLGGIARVGAHAELGYAAESVATAEITREAFVDAWSDRVSAPDPGLLPAAKVVAAVAKVCGFDPEVIKRRGRGNQSLTAARDLAMYKLREWSGLTSSQTAALFDGRSHTTVLAALKRYAKRRKTDQQLTEAERRVDQLLR